MAAEENAKTKEDDDEVVFEKEMANSSQMK